MRRSVCANATTARKKNARANAAAEWLDAWRRWGDGQGRSIRGAGHHPGTHCANPAVGSLQNEGDAALGEAPDPEPADEDSSLTGDAVEAAQPSSATVPVSARQEPEPEPQGDGEDPAWDDDL